MTSSAPAAAAATTGVPLAMASRYTCPSVSKHEGEKKASAEA